MRSLWFATLLAACTGTPSEDGVTPAPWDSGRSGASDSGTGGTDPRFAPILEAMQADLDNNLATAVQVAVWMDGEVVAVGALGTADPDGAVPVTDRTLFAIGSDTKKLTALRLLQEVDAGALSLGTTVGEVLPDLTMALAPEFQGATVAQLLRHQGGIVDSSPWSTTTSDDELLAYTLGDFASAFYPLAPPGSFWNYANPNFSVAGAIDEATAGAPWADLLTESLTGPLGMSRTFGRRADCDADHTDGVGYADPGAAAPSRVAFEDTWESAWVRPAGLVWSTASDQARLAGFLLHGNGDVLDPALLPLVSDPAAPVYPDLPGSYGMGLFVDSAITLPDGEATTPVWFHGGNTLTHTSSFWVFPEHDFAISVLSNGYGDAFDNTLLAAFSELVDLGERSEPDPLPFDATALDALTGTYRDDFNVGRLIVSRDGDAGLRIDAPLLDELGVPYTPELTPVTTRIWLWTAQGSTFQLDFLTDGDGVRWVRNRVFAASDCSTAVEATAASLRGLPVRPPRGPSPLDARLRFRR